VLHAFIGSAIAAVVLGIGFVGAVIVADILVSNSLKKWNNYDKAILVCEAYALQIKRKPYEDIFVNPKIVRRS